MQSHTGTQIITKSNNYPFPTLSHNTRNKKKIRFRVTIFKFQNDTPLIINIESTYFNLVYLYTDVIFPVWTLLEETIILPNLNIVYCSQSTKSIPTDTRLYGIPPYTIERRPAFTLFNDRPKYLYSLTKILLQRNSTDEFYIIHTSL